MSELASETPNVLDYKDTEEYFCDWNPNWQKKIWSPRRAVVMCRYCHSDLSIWMQGYKFEQFDENTERTLKICPQCGYWLYLEEHIWDMSYFVYEAVLKKFSIGDDEIPINILKHELAYNWKLTKHISDKRAEDLVASIFSEHLDCEVEFLSNSVYSPDGGIDFVLVRKNSGEEIAFQVKRRRNSKSESVIPVRAFLGAITNSKYKQAFYVTTADQYSNAVKKEFNDLSNLKRRGIDFSLVDGTRLSHILGLHAEHESIQNRFISHLTGSLESRHTRQEALRCHWFPREKYDYNSNSWMDLPGSIALHKILENIFK